MAVGSKSDRQGIETYLLAQLAAPATTLIHSRGTWSSSANFSARYAFLKSVSVFVRLIPAPIDTIFRSITVLKILIAVRSTWEAKNFRILAPSRASPRQG